MSEIRITVLGTSASAPTKDRGMPSVLIEFEGKGYLFDVGEGTQRQFMRFGRSFMRVDHIFISHHHGDHVLGLPGLLSTMGLYDRDRPLHIWAPTRQIPYIERLVRSIPLGIDYDVYFHGVDEGVLLQEKKFNILAYPLDHTTDCYAYVFAEHPKKKADKKKVKELGIEGPLVRELKAGIPVFFRGKEIRPEEIIYTVPGRKIVYAVDTRPVIHDYAKDPDVLIHEATFLHADLDKAIEKKHTTALEAAQLARELNAKRLILLHFSARIKELSVVEAEARSLFPNTVAAEDGYTLPI